MAALRRNKSKLRPSTVPARVRASFLREAHKAAEAGRTYEEKRYLYKAAYSRLWSSYRYQHEAVYRNAMLKAGKKWRKSQAA
jgi:hypothetical protein